MGLETFDQLTTKYGFTVETAVYKTVYAKNGTKQDVKVDIWISRAEGPVTKRPIILFLHGGFLITGHRAFTPFINGWLPDFATKHNAIVVSPDYRLLPESTGQDVLEDLEDAWQWMTGTASNVQDIGSHSNLTAFLKSAAPNAEVDLSHILVTGGSAGGFCALHVALNHASEIKSLLLQYPMCDVDSAWYREGLPAYNPKSSNADVKPLGINPLPETQYRELEKAALIHREAGDIVSGGGFERAPACVSSILYGRWYDLVVDGVQEHDQGSRLDPVIFRRMEKDADLGLPGRIFIVHGTADTAVPSMHSEKLANLIRERFEGSKVRLELFEGAEHGCDNEEDAVSSPRIQDNLDWAMGR